MPDIFDLIVACQPPPPNGQPKPPEGPKPPPSNVLDVCGQFQGTLAENGWPLPGSNEFCAVVSDIGTVFSSIGESFTGWLDQPNPLEQPIISAGIPLPVGALAAPIAAVIGFWNELLKALQRVIRSIGDELTTVIKSAISLQNCLYKRCKPGVSFGIWVMRQLVKVFERVRVGWDFAIWFTVDIDVEFEEVKRWLEMVQNYFCPIEIPGPELATKAFILDRITKEHRNCIWLLHGLDPDTYEEFALTEREQLDWREAVQYVRRIGGGEEQEDGLLRKRGFVTQDDVLMAKEMYWELPGIADHLQWLRRNVFDTDYVKDYQLLDGFAEDAEINSLPGMNGYVSVAKRPGKTFWEAFGHDLTALGMRQNYAANHYAAHWIQPSPEQMREMVYRSQEIAALTGKGFTEDDYERILTEQDYSPLARKWFRAIIYQVPAISYIKEWYRQSIINKDELTEYHHRLGFSPKDAQRFADIDDLQKKRMRAAAAKGWTTGAATNAAISGQITDDQQEEIYAQLGYTSEEATTARIAARASFNGKVVQRAKTRALSAITSLVSQAIDVGVMSPQAAADNLRISGWPKDQAEGFAGLMAQSGSVKKVKQAITYVRRHVIDGGITFPVAQQELQRLGLTSEATDNYLSLWRLQMTPGRKKRTAAQIVADVANRHITTADAINRLVNLGYNDADTRLYLADAQAKLVKTQQGLIAAQQKKGLQAIKEQERIAKEMQRQRRQLQADMLKATPVKTLQAWAKRGIISHKRFVSRLMQMGWTRPDAELYYVEACKTKGAECTETEPNATGDGGSGGGGGPNGGGSEGGTGDVPQHG